MGVYYRTFLFSLFSYFHLLSTKNSVTLFFFFEHFAKKMVENSHGKCSTDPSKSAVIHPPPIVLLVEIDKNENCKLIFIRVFCIHFVLL